MAISHLPTLILCSDNDIHHVGFWARGMAKQQRPNDIDDVAKQFSEGLLFSYAHLAGKCKRKYCLMDLVKELICSAQVLVVMYVKKKLVN